ncbi:integrase core domain protein, partial [Mycobacterium avium MAV_120709_2344]|uniref:IS630 family transposase n=1 Tax=Mycobacterium avium TaxID=1764 RepID=UPI00044E03ED
HRGLLDQPRRPAPVVGDERIEALITATLETTRLMPRTGRRARWPSIWLSQSMVSRVWRAFGLAPHKQDSWKLSKDPLFVQKVRDVVGLYLNPPERAVVLCVDEKTQIQALNRTAPVFPMLPGTPARASHDYVRHGTSSLYAALDLATGQVIGALHSRHRAQEFLAFLKKIDAHVPADLDCHVVLDNASTHKTPQVKRWLTAHPRFVLHFTPTSSSWLNLVERWFAELTTKKLRRGTHTSVRQLNTDIRTWIQTWNDNPRPYVWTKTADQILESIANYCKRINDSQH